MREMKKLQEVRQARQPPKQEQNKQAQMQIVNVTYGHNGSGKLYSYYGQNKRVGDIVTPEVTNQKTGKSYKTLGVVRSTRQVANAINTVAKVGNIKTLGETEQRSLPNYYKGWDKDAQAAYDLKKEVQLDSSFSKGEKVSLLQSIKSMREEDKLAQRLFAKSKVFDDTKAKRRLLGG